ncbi:hypothetical protein GRX03_00285 [Halovenus sp. WSH3]|uniref:histidine kinase n=1 Tax=Halovenus carboxidivorans TaxID=2692199 RepID=A0A6B0SXX2_9EURY|nr:ATP-binding protein [Halovenus carboxidivorans]MXR50047.1 hypothetical protein [Halovenus carboxidivorans]
MTASRSDSTAIGWSAVSKPGSDLAVDLPAAVLRYLQADAGDRVFYLVEDEGTVLAYHERDVPDESERIVGVRTVTEQSDGRPTVRLTSTALTLLDAAEDDHIYADDGPGESARLHHSPGRPDAGRDVTDRRQREQILDVLNRVLRHNLRNELSVIKSRTGIVEERLEDPGLRTHLEKTAEAVDSLVGLGEEARVIERALEYDTVPTEVDVDELLDEITAETVPPAGTVEMSGESTTVRTDRYLLAVALENIVENAVEHTTDGRPWIRIRTVDTGAGVHIRVDDNGPGIPQVEVDVIRRGRETATEHGSSMGLWLISWAATACGGTASFGDGPDGARVDLWIPDQPASD